MQKPNAKETIQRYGQQRFNKTTLAELSITAIKQHCLVFFCELPYFLPCSERTLYNYRLQDLQSIKDALEGNKLTVKRELRSKMRESNHPLHTVMLYKLLADENELERLSSNNKPPSNLAQEKPFTFTLNLNPDNRVRERLQFSETKQISGESDFIDVQIEDD
jgi:hypothetical protein